MKNKLASCRIAIEYEHAKLIPQIRKYAVIVQTDYEGQIYSYGPEVTTRGQRKNSRTSQACQSNREKLGQRKVVKCRQRTISLAWFIAMRFFP